MNYVIFTFFLILGFLVKLKILGDLRANGSWSLGLRGRIIRFFKTRNPLSRSKFAWLGIAPLFIVLSCACILASSHHEFVSRNTQESTVNLVTSTSQAILEGESGFA